MSLAQINQIFLRILQMKVERFCDHFCLAMFSSQKGSRYENKENRQKTKQSRKPNRNLFQCFFLFLFFFFLTF